MGPQGPERSTLCHNPQEPKQELKGQPRLQGLDLDTSTAACLGIQTLPNKTFLKTCHVL